MPAAQVIDLSPTPNRSGALFGEGFADAYNERDKQKRNNDWFQEAIGDETDPLQQAAKLGMSKHPLDPEYVKEKRRQLFENAEYLMQQDRYEKGVAAEERKRKMEDAALTKKASDEDLQRKKEARTLEILEDQLGLERGTFSGGDVKTLEPFAREKVKGKPKDKSEAEKDQKKALFDTYPKETADIPVEARDNLTAKDIQNHIKNKQVAENRIKSGLSSTDPAVKSAYKDYEEIKKVGKTAADTLRTVKDARKAVEEGGGDANAKNWIGQMIPWFKSGSTAALENASTELFKHFKTIFPKMTNVDVHLIEDVLPAVYNSREANNAILDIYESGANYAKEKERISDELIEQMNKGEIQPYEFPRLLKERTDALEDEALDAIRETATAIRDRITDRVEEGYTAMISTSGAVAQIPNDRVEEALNSKQWKLYGR